MSPADDIAALRKRVAELEEALTDVVRLDWTSTPDGFRELRKPIDEERFQDWVAALSGKK